MGIAHFVDGEKGGVGKSFFARVLCQFYQDKNLPYQLIDTDTANPDVSNIYSKSQKPITWTEVDNKQK